MMPKIKEALGIMRSYICHGDDDDKDYDDDAAPPTDKGAMASAGFPNLPKKIQNKEQKKATRVSDGLSRRGSGSS